MKKLVFIAAIFAAILSVSFLVSWRVFISFVSQPSEVTVSARKVMVAPDTTASGLVRLLKAEGLVTQTFMLDLYLNRFRKPGEFQPGEYELSGLMTPSQIIDQIQEGKVVTYALAIESGQTSADIAQTLADKGFGKASAIEQEAMSPDFAKSLELPHDRLEGYLFPGTYDLPREQKPAVLLRTLVKRFHEKVNDSIIKEAASVGLSLQELVVLASIIASEKVPAEELRMVSSVYHNRLKAKMKLEHEGSLAYGLGKSRAELTPNDRLDENDWNTFLRAGLPKTPIANPGYKAILAAVRPAKSDALYFAPRNESSHIFCPDAECHAIAMRRWRETQKEQRDAKKP